MAGMDFRPKKNIHAQSLLYYIPLDKTILLLQLFTLRNLLDETKKEIGFELSKKKMANLVRKKWI